MGFGDVSSLHLADFVGELGLILGIVVFDRSFVAVGEDLVHAGLEFAICQVLKTEGLLAVRQQAAQELDLVVLVQQPFVLNSHDIQHVLILTMVGWHFNSLCPIPSHGNVFVHFARDGPID